MLILLGEGGGGLSETQTNTSVIRYLERAITEHQIEGGIKLVFVSPFLLSMTFYYLLAIMKIRNLCSLLS